MRMVNSGMNSLISPTLSWMMVALQLNYGLCVPFRYLVYSYLDSNKRQRNHNRDNYVFVRNNVVLFLRFSFHLSAVSYMAATHG